MADNNILVLAFSSDSFNLEDLNGMTSAERYELATMEEATGYGLCAVSDLDHFTTAFNTGCVDPDHSYIYFHSL